MRVSFVLLDDLKVKDHVLAAISKVEKAFGVEIEEISIKQQGSLRLYNFKSDVGANVTKSLEEWDSTKNLEVYLVFKVNINE